MSYPYGRPRFQDEELPGVDEYYGSINSAPYTRVRCPSCNQIIIVPAGHFDTVHECTIICPWSNNEMLPIPSNPSQAVVPLVFKSGTDVMMDGWQAYFYYCPNPACPYLLQYEVAYIQKRVMTEILVSRT